MNNIKLKNSLNLKFFCEIKDDNFILDITDCVYKKCRYYNYIFIDKDNLKKYILFKDCGLYYVNDLKYNFNIVDCDKTYNINDDNILINMDNDELYLNKTFMDIDDELTNIIDNDLSIQKDGYSICFVITSIYVRGYDSYIKKYVDNIQKFYKNSFIIIVDNNSLHLRDIEVVLKNYKNIIILTNTSNSKYEVGGYTFGLKWIIDNNKTNYDYYLFSQANFIIENKYDFNKLKYLNIQACPIVEHIEDFNYGNANYYEEHDQFFEEKINILNRYNIKHINTNVCWGNTFVIHKNKLYNLYNYIKSQTLTLKKHSCMFERIMGFFIKQLEPKNFNIDGFLTHIHSLKYFTKKGQSYKLNNNNMYDNEIYNNIFPIIKNNIITKPDFYQLTSDIKINYGINDNNIDVTKKVFDKYKNDYIIFIPETDESRALIFGDPLFGTIKSLFVYDNGTNITYEIYHNETAYIDLNNNKLYVGHYPSETIKYDNIQYIISKNTNKIDINNICSIFSHVMSTSKCLLYICDYDFFSHIFCINIDNNCIYKYANEWLYLINEFNINNNAYNSTALNNYINTYNTIIQNNMKQIVHIDENVLQLFTTFSRGAVHGFSGFYYTLIEYITNFDKYKDLKLIIYKETQNGMLDIINFLCEKNIINRSKIIYIEKNTYYSFLSVTFIPNCFHVFYKELIPIVDTFIKKYLLSEILDIKENICLLKIENGSYINPTGLFKLNIVEEFSKKYSFDIINTHNEIELINRIYNCSILLISYGSTFFKNFIYISEKCKKIIVIVKDSYIGDYNRFCETSVGQGTIVKKYKNADFIYKIIDNDELNFNPFEE